MQIPGSWRSPILLYLWLVQLPLHRHKQTETESLRSCSQEEQLHKDGPQPHGGWLLGLQATQIHLDEENGLDGLKATVMLRAGPCEPGLMAC